VSRELLSLIKLDAYKAPGLQSDDGPERHEASVAHQDGPSAVPWRNLYRDALRRPAAHFFAAAVALTGAPNPTTSTVVLAIIVRVPGLDGLGLHTSS